MPKTATLSHDPVAAATTAIDKLKELQPDWDSYGAGAPNLMALEQAKNFVYDIARSLGPEYVSPIVGPTSDGGVALIWRKRGQPKIEAFFSPEQGNRFVVLRDRKLLDKGTISNPKFLRQYIVP